MTTRPAPFRSLTSVEAVEFIKRLAGHTDHEIAAKLNAAGLRTGSGQPFDVTAVRWVRYVHRIPSAHTDPAPGELTIPQVAARLEVGVSAIYHWVGYQVAELQVVDTASCSQPKSKKPAAR